MIGAFDMKKDSVKKTFVSGKALKAIIIGSIVGSAVSVFAIILASTIIVKLGMVPYEVIVPIVIAAIVIGAFIGGYITARINKTSGMAMGAVCATVMFVLCLGTGTASGGVLGITVLLRLLLMIVSGAVGGILGVNKRRRR